MSLDKIQMPPFLLEELYKNALISEDNKTLNINILKEDKNFFLGKNLRKILLIVNEEKVDHISDENLPFLIGILDACKLALPDVALLNIWSNEKIKYHQLQDKFKPEVILFFGVEPEKLGFPLQFPHYQVQAYNNQKYLCAPSLTTLAENKPQKQLLWASLKKLFSL